MTLTTFLGWADPYNAAVWPIQHLHQIQSAIGGKQSDVSDFFQLFMIPGMCISWLLPSFVHAIASLQYQNILARRSLQVHFPGGGHCGAASSYPQVPAIYHTIPELITWVEQGRKPASIKSTDPP